MLILLASIACSVAVSVLLKVARQRGIDVTLAIGVNYAMAVTLCLVLLKPQPATLLRPDAPWPVLLALGVLLLTIFVAMAGAVRHAGIVLSDAAQRLSLVIPLAAAFLIFGEALSGSKLLGLGLALTALLCLLAKPGRGAGVPGRSLTTIGYLLAMWVGYGVIDIERPARIAMRRRWRARARRERQAHQAAAAIRRPITRYFA